MMFRGTALRDEALPEDFRIGRWLVQPKLNSISAYGLDTRLEPKVMQVLVCLAERGGDVVPKEQLIRRVWSDTFVTDDVLTRCISELRKAFEDDSKESRVIQTIPKSGYRLIVPVEWIGRNSRASSLAVLPFVNSNGSDDLEYLSDGITECIISTLSQLPQLRVISRGAVFRYKGRDVDPQAVGKDLNVQAVLTGRVLERGDTLVVRAELTDVAHGWQLWGEQYNRGTADILAVEDDIAREISEKLQLRLTGEQQKRLARRATESTQAYHLYLRARYLWNRRTEESLRQAIDYFEQAIAHDPGYALAHSGLADCYGVLGCQLDYGTFRPAEAYLKAEAAARGALELDDSLAEAHTSLGNVLKAYYWDWPAAEREFRRGLELNPRYATAHHWYALLLITLGRVEEAIREIKLAHELEPFSLMINTDGGEIHYLARQYDAAIERLRLALDLEPNFVPAHIVLAQAYEGKGMVAEAAAELEKVKGLLQPDSVPVAVFGRSLVAVAKSETTRGLEELQELSKRRYVPACCLAALYHRLGNRELTFEWMEKALEERSSWLTYVRRDPLFDNLHSDPRFESIMRRVGLPA